jgi:hypothetical protein
LNEGGWMSIAEVETELRAGALSHESVGYLVAQNAEAIALALSVSRYDDDHVQKVGDVLLIPKVAITHAPVRLVARRRSGKGEA